jgi:hypothetical protein
MLNMVYRYTDHSPNDQSPNDHSLNDQSPNDQSSKATILRTTILRTTNLRKRPILGRLIIAKPDPQWAQFSQWVRTEKKSFTHSPGFSLSAAPDFSSVTQATGT